MLPLIHKVRPDGTMIFGLLFPCDESHGYFRWALWKICFFINHGMCVNVFGDDHTHSSRAKTCDIHVNAHSPILEDPGSMSGMTYYR